MKLLSALSLMLISIIRTEENDTGYKVLSDKTLQGTDEYFNGKCDMVRFIKLVINAKDVSGGLQILERLDQAANVEFKIENKYYYSLIICYSKMGEDGKTRSIIDKMVFFNLNNQGPLTPLPEGCPVPIPPLVPPEVKDDCKMGYQLGRIINKSIAYQAIY